MLFKCSFTGTTVQLHKSQNQREHLKPERSLTKGKQYPQVHSVFPYLFFSLTQSTFITSARGCLSQSFISKFILTVCKGNVAIFHVDHWITMYIHISVETHSQVSQPENYALNGKSETKSSCDYISAVPL